MKFLKLFLCFAAISAAIVGLVFISSGEKNHATKGVNSECYNRCDSIINSEWADGAEWSKECFDNREEYLEIYKSDLGSGYITLLNKFHELVIARLYDTAVYELGKRNCKDATMKRLKQDFDYVMGKTTSKFAKNDKVVQFKEVYGLYQKALSLSGRDFIFSTDYSMNAEYGSRWRKLDADIDDLYEQRRKIVGNDMYYLVSNVDKINKGLGVEFTQKVENCKTDFRNSLAKDICQAYKSDCSRNNIVNSVPVECKEDLDPYTTELARLDAVYEQLYSTYNEFLYTFGEESTIVTLMDNLRDIRASYDEKISRSKQNINNNYNY